MTDTTVDKTDPAKTTPKPGDKAVTTPTKSGDDNAAGAQAALHNDASHPALATKTSDATPATPAKSESETLADKLHADLGWAFNTVKSGTKALVADVTAAVTPKDAAAATPGKDAVTGAAATKDGTPAKPGAPGTPAAEAAGVAPKDGTPAKPGAPGTPATESATAKTPATKDVPPPTLATKPASTGMFSSAMNYLGSAATSAENAIVSETTSAYNSAASLGGEAAGALSTDVSSLYSGLASAASGAKDTFTNVFGTGADAMQQFANTAEQVTNIDEIIDMDPKKLFSGVNADGVNRAADTTAAEKAAKAAGINWMVPGDNKPGGTPTVAAKDGQEIGSGTNKDGIDVSTKVTATSSEARAALVEANVNPKGAKTEDPDYITTKQGDIETVHDKKSGETFLFNDKTKQVTVENPKNGTNEVISANGDVATQVSPQTQINQVGDSGAAANTAAAQAAAAGHPETAGPVQSRYFADGNNMAMVQSDGMVYKYNTKNETLEVGKDNHWVEKNFKTGKVSYYTEDPVTHKRTDVPSGSLPKGVTMGSDGSIAVNGATVADAHGQMLHVGAAGSTYNVNSKTYTTEGTGGPVTVKSMGDQGTQLNGPGDLQVKVPAKPTPGAAEISVGGEKIPLEHNAADGSYKLSHADGASVTVGNDGSIQQRSVNGQNTGIDSHGNISATDAQGNSLFNINNHGCVGLYDGTQFNPDGEISNANTGFDMQAYHRSPIDYYNVANDMANSTGYDASSASGNGSGYSDSGDGSSGYSSQDGSGSDGTTPDTTVAANGTDAPNGTDAANGPDAQNSIETAALRSGDEDIMNSATFDALENKVDSTLDRIKAKWNFGKDVEENKDDKLAGREDGSEFSKWMHDIRKGDLVDLPKEWKIKGLVQNLDLSTFEKGDKDSLTPGVASVGDLASLQSFKEKLDDLSIKLGINTSYFESKIDGMEQKIEKKLAATQSLEEQGLAPTADRLKRVQDGGNSTVIANQFGPDERATA